MPKKQSRREYLKQYRRTFNGMVARMYDKMRQRCIRLDCRTPELYRGKFIPDYEAFKVFAVKSVDLLRLYKQWKKNDFALKFRPVPDRKNTDLGYELFNIRFITYSENNRLSGKKLKKRRKKTKRK